MPDPLLLADLSHSTVGMPSGPRDPSVWSTTGNILFEGLMGLDVVDPDQLFTCERKTTRRLPALPPRRAPWPHRKPLRARPINSIGPSEIGVGILVAGRNTLLAPGGARVGFIAAGRDDTYNLRVVSAACRQGDVYADLGPLGSQLVQYGEKVRGVDIWLPGA